MMDLGKPPDVRVLPLSSDSVVNQERGEGGVG